MHSWKLSGWARVLGIAVGLMAAGGWAQAKTKTKTKAKAQNESAGPIEPKSGAKLNGDYKLSQSGKTVTLVVHVENAPPGEHAVHIHENPDCSDPEGKKAGGHFNPTAEPHGQWGHDHFHLGDVGNLKVGQDGKGELTFSTDKWTLDSGDPKTDVAGHSLVVHEKVDDFTTQPTGNAGSRIGCAVIAKKEAKSTP